MNLNLEMAPNGERHTKIRRKLEQLIMMSQSKMSDLHEGWKKAEDKFYCYVPAKEVDELRKSKRDLQGKPQYTTLIIPYSYAMLMTAHTYWTSVFFARDPVFQFTARHGEGPLNEQAIEALIDYQRVAGQWLVPLYIWLLDMGRYGVGILGHHWCEEYVNVAKIEEIDDLFMGMIPTGKKKRQKTIQRVEKYSGNRLYNVRPYDWFPDTRVPMHRFQEGTFDARYVEISWEEIIANKDYNGYFNLEDLKKKRYSERWKTREEGSSAPVRPDNWRQTIDETDPPPIVPAYEIVVKVIPPDWMLGGTESVEKWVFTITSDFGLIFGARPLGELHDMFPKSLLMLEAEGYTLSSRGIMEILEPMQNTLDWLVNTHFYNVRKTLNNQFLLDPSRVHLPDALDPRAGGIIRTLPAGYGQDVRTMLAQLPVGDVTQAHMKDAALVMEMMQRVMGITDSVMGVMPSGGRRTAQEVRTSTTFSTNRLKTNSEYASAMGFTPLAQMLVQSTQQHYSAEKMFKRAGNLLSPGAEAHLRITPDQIAGFYDYVPVDGTIPIDRFQQAQMATQMIQMIAQNPALTAQYDMGGIFAWSAGLAGFKNLGQFRFKVQLGSDEQIMYQYFKGNAVDYATAKAEIASSGSFGGGQPGGAEGDNGPIPELGQVPGMGQTA